MLTFNNNQKNIVLVYTRDRSGCSHYRHRFQSFYLNSLEQQNVEIIKSFTPIFQDDILFRTKTIICQRFVTQQDAQLLERYKALQQKFGYKLVFEVDDQCFSINGQGIPSYNSASDNFNKNITIFDDVLTKTLPLYDEIVVSTDFLKRVIEMKFGVRNVTVLRNVIPRYLWSYPHKKEITEDLVHPRVLYSGSPCHYRGPSQNNVPMTGDFSQPWIDWVKKNVTENKIEFICMGSIPWFFVDIEDKIKVINWVPTIDYPRAVMETGADFQIAPLVDNDFNRCKSALRLYESSAAGQVFLGTVFSESPYLEAHPSTYIDTNMTFEDIDKVFWNLCKKDNYNKVLDWQYDFVNAGKWLESDRYLNQLNNIIENRINSFI